MSKNKEAFGRFKKKIIQFYCAPPHKKLPFWQQKFPLNNNNKKFN